MPEIEKEKEIEIEKKNVKSIAGHIIDEKTDEKEKTNSRKGNTYWSIMPRRLYLHLLLLA